MQNQFFKCCYNYFGLQENPCHDSLAVKLCNEILSHPDSFAVKLWIRALVQLNISPDNLSLHKDLYEMTERIGMVSTIEAEVSSSLILFKFHTLSSYHNLQVHRCVLLTTIHLHTSGSPIAFSDSVALLRLSTSSITFFCLFLLPYPYIIPVLIKCLFSSYC